MGQGDLLGLFVWFPCAAPCQSASREQFMDDARLFDSRQSLIESLEAVA